MIHDAVVHKITRRNPSLQDWPYYGIVDILNPTTMAGYQHYLSLTSKSGMAHDFRDLRFFQPDGTEIPFWVESDVLGASAIIWFKPHLSSLKNIYCYYGNRDAVSQSNGDAVFELFDEFLGSSLNAAKWATGGSPTISVANSECAITDSTTNYRYIKSLLTFGQDTALRCRVKCGHSGVYYNYWGYSADVGSAGDQAYANDAYGSQYSFYTKSSGTGSNATGLGATDTNYYIWDIQRNSVTPSAIIVKAGTTLTTKTTNIPTTSLPVVFEVYTSTITVDFAAVRKYTATEPVCQLNQSGLRNPAYR